MAESQSSPATLTPMLSTRNFFMMMEAKETVSYVVPSFPVLTVNLRHVRYQIFDDDGGEVFDRFTCQCLSMKRNFPAIVEVESGYSNAFFVEEGEFSRSIDLSDAKLSMRKVFIMWNFKWYDGDDQSEEEETNSEEEHERDASYEESESENAEEDKVEPNIVHAVTFKCIGSVRDLHAQEVLTKASAARRNGVIVPVRLTPEPTNPKDKKAICFQCCIEGKWERIGYVVREALDSVHLALSKSLIVSVEFDWIKYVVHWSKSGPGWYTGIKITRKGNWPTDVLRSKSSDF